MILRSLVFAALAFSASAHAASGPKQIGLNASGAFFGIYREQGIAGATAAIRNCYDTANSGEAYLYCLAMDTQAKRMDEGVAKRLNAEPSAYFSDAEYGQRVSVMQRWYRDANQRSYAMNAMMDGVDVGLEAELARIQP